MENINHFLDRYDNHIQTPGIGVPGQEAISKSKIMVIADGDLTSPVLTYLVSMGTGTVGIVATGKIEMRSLPGQPLLFNSQGGKLKAQSIAGQLREVNPEVKVKVHEQNPDTQNVLETISGYDMVIDGSQNIEMSLLINDACVILGKPIIFGKLLSPCGYLSVFNYKGGSTLRCALQQNQASEILRENARSGLASLGAIIGSHMANEAMKIVTQIGDSMVNKIIRINTYKNQLEQIAVEPVKENLSMSTLGQNTLPTETHLQESPIRSISPGLLAIKIKYKETLQLIHLAKSDASAKQDSWNYKQIPAEQLLNDLGQIHQDIPVVLISENGESAKSFASTLNSRHGFDNIYYLEGGMCAWLKETGTSSIIYESI